MNFNLLTFNDLMTISSWSAFSLILVSSRCEYLATLFDSSFSFLINPSKLVTSSLTSFGSVCCLIGCLVWVSVFDESVWPVVNPLPPRPGLVVVGAVNEAGVAVVVAAPNSPVDAGQG